MDRWIGKIAVVTGASSGIGAGICEKFVELGIHVAGFARRVEKVQDLAGKMSGSPGKILAIKCDVTKQSDVIQCFEEVKNKMGPVSILVNNAGLYKQGTVIEGSSDDWRQVFETNVLGMAMCTQQAVKQMREENIKGHIFNINSVSGHQTIVGHPPLLNVYSPSKFAVTSLGEVMRMELGHFDAKIKVTSISPGMVETDIFATAGTPVDFEKCDAMKPGDIADAVIYALATPANLEVQEITLAPIYSVHKF